MPACILGCKVFTRPSNTSLKPVYSEISVTAILFDFKYFAVPPEDKISTLCLASSLASSKIPSLLKTLSKAVLILIIIRAHI